MILLLSSIQSHNNKFQNVPIVKEIVNLFKILIKIQLVFLVQYAEKIKKEKAGIATVKKKQTIVISMIFACNV